MKKNISLLSMAICIIPFESKGQDAAKYKLMLSFPLFNFPQNSTLPQYAPSMQQSLELSNDFYELSFEGIDALGNKLFIPNDWYSSMQASLNTGGDLFF